MVTAALRTVAIRFSPESARAICLRRETGKGCLLVRGAWLAQLLVEPVEDVLVGHLGVHHARVVAFPSARTATLPPGSTAPDFALPGWGADRWSPCPLGFR